MKRGDWEPPESYHCIHAAGIIVQVDEDTRKEVESFLRGCTFPEDYFKSITIETILGETVTIIADAINSIYDTTPETRCKQRQLGVMMDQEALAQGFSDA